MLRKPIAFMLPLAVDSFAAAIGATAVQRWRIVAMFTAFGGRDASDRCRPLGRFPPARGLADVELGVSIGFDELAVGVGLGLVRLAVFVIAVAVQTFASAQL